MQNDEAEGAPEAPGEFSEEPNVEQDFQETEEAEVEQQEETYPEEEAEVEQQEETYPEEEAEVEQQEETYPEEEAEVAEQADDFSMGVFGPGGEAPDMSEVAEIILIGTSLGSIKRQFFSSKRLQHFMDCKGMVYFLIDCNRDLSAAMNLKDVSLFKEWKALGLLRTNQDSEDGAEVVLPQLLVDGIVLGGEDDLQELEEDGDLDWIFARAACPCCLHEKPTGASNCESCGAVFTSLIPPEVLASGGVQQMLQGYTYSTSEDNAEERLKERWASGLQQADFELDLGNEDSTED